MARERKMGGMRFPCHQPGLARPRVWLTVGAGSLATSAISQLDTSIPSTVGRHMYGAMGGENGSSVEKLDSSLAVALVPDDFCCRDSRGCAFPPMASCGSQCFHGSTSPSLPKPSAGMGVTERLKHPLVLQARHTPDCHTHSCLKNTR